MNLFTTKSGKNYLMPFVLVTSLFFLWGFAHSILDVLNKHFQSELEVTKAESGLVQAMVYGGYFLMALPAGWIIRRRGYRRGVVTGLLLYGTGALLFIPGERLMSFPFFLLSLFIIGCGLTCLETSANPYVTILGKPEDGARRLNLAQSFNGLGWIMGPMVGSLLILGEESRLALPYVVVGGIVLALGVIFSRIDLPEPQHTADEPKTTITHSTPLWKRGAFMTGVFTLFLYVAAQTGINSFFINFVGESATHIDARTAGLILSVGGMGMFLTGRLGGSKLMQFVAPAKLLGGCAIGATICMTLVVADMGLASVVALCAVYLFESIMFPTIFALSLLKADGRMEQASSMLIMSIVGGAIAPVLMGYIGQQSMAAGFVVPLVCFVEILWYAWISRK